MSKKNAAAKNAAAQQAARKEIVIGISTSALFDMRESDKLFRSKGLEKYQDHMIKNENAPFAPGHAFALLEVMRDINKAVGYQMFKMVLVSKNDVFTGARAVNSCYHYDLPLASAMFSGGKPTADYLPAYDVDWFICTRKEDVEAAAKAGIAASKIDSPLLPAVAAAMALNAQNAAKAPAQTAVAATDTLAQRFNKKLHLVWDLDRVVFGPEADDYFTQHGLEPYLTHERTKAQEEISDGPFVKIARAAGEIAKTFPDGESPVISSAITARSGSAALRAMLSLRKKGVEFNGMAHFIADGGARKARVLEVMAREQDKTIIFLDDSAPTIDHTSKVVMSGLVPKTTGGLALGEKRPDEKPVAAPKPKQP